MLLYTRHLLHVFPSRDLSVARVKDRDTFYGDKADVSRFHLLFPNKVAFGLNIADRKIVSGLRYQVSYAFWKALTCIYSLCTDTCHQGDKMLNHH